MGLLKALWGGSSRPKVTDQDKMILDLKLQRDRIRQYQKRIVAVKQREHDLAKECLAQGDKDRALLFLRKKKFQEQLLSKTDGQLANLEELAANIEFALIQKDILYGLEQGNAVLKEINAEMSMDRVERIMDESAEGIAYQAEVSDMLAERISNADELEIQDELAALEAEEAAKTGQKTSTGGKQLPNVPNLPPLQAPPQHVPQSEGARQAATEEEAAETREAMLA